MVIIGIIYRFIRKRIAFGLADYIAVFGVSFIISPDNWHMFLVFCGGIGILIGFIQKPNESDHIPFIPAILISALIVETLLI
jgi:prepilin signal peptidase PulO-like enzyme (type II secretory pathway)